MVSRIFLWFYCLPIPQALVLAGLCTGLLFFLHHRLGHFRWWQALMGVFPAAGALAIVWQTLLSRTPGAFQPPILQLLDSYRQVLSGGTAELLRSNFMNVMLFYPLGLFTALPACRARHPKLRTAAVTAAFFLLSCAIEYAQMRFGLGLCEADDILHNTLGAFLGAEIAGRFCAVFPDS